MDRLLDLIGSLADLSLPPVGEAYWVRELTPGWPPAFHPPRPLTDRMIEVPVVDLQIAGALILLAIVCLVGVTLAGNDRRKRRARRR